MERPFPQILQLRRMTFTAVILTATAADSEKAVKLKWKRSYSVFLGILQVAMQ